jgi:predicted RNA binding protein YcfA (HicA-like mRNA interferase family)
MDGTKWPEKTAQFKHPQKPGRVTVPHPERDTPIGTLRSIEKPSGLKLR